MSADNWTVCPRCSRKWDEEAAKAEADLDDRYGKVTREEWENVRAGIALIHDTPKPVTLREDYEIHSAESGEVVVEYSCSCRKCGLTGAFAYSHRIDGADR